MTAHELLRRMPEVLDRDAAAEVDAVIQYEVDDPVFHVVEHGDMTIHEGRADAPDLVVEVSDDDLMQLFHGQLNPLTAFMTGRVKVQGDMQLAQRLMKLVDRDRLEEVARASGGSLRI